jgi:hypothetical protein
MTWNILTPLYTADGAVCVLESVPPELEYQVELLYHVGLAPGEVVATGVVPIAPHNVAELQLLVKATM